MVIYYKICALTNFFGLATTIKIGHKSSMQKRWKLAIYTLLAYAAYIISMKLAPQFLDTLLGEWPLIIGTRLSRQFRDTELLYFCTAHMGLFGCIIPLAIAYKFDLKPHRRVSSKILTACAVILVGSFLFYADYQGFLSNMLKPDPDPAYMTEALFYVFPFALGLCVFSCYLIPRMVMVIMNGHPLSHILEAASAAASMYYSWFNYVNTTAHVMPEKIFWTGMIIAAAGALSRSFYLSFAICFSALYGATMVHPVFYKTSWQSIFPGFLIAICALCLYISSRNKRSFPPASYFAG